MAYIEIKNLNKIYRVGNSFISALDRCNLEIEKGKLTLIVGQSGAGKTTLLNLLGGMDTPTAGSIVVDGKDISNFSARELTKYRRDDVGFVFQFYNLIQNLTALENVELASQICVNPLDPKKVMDQVGLTDRMLNFPAQLSGGEQQRVAIARAVAKNPKLLLCDEPTGALDYETGRQVLALLQMLCMEQGMTVVIITHNTALAPIADRVIRFKNGRVREVRENENPLPVSEVEW